MNTQPEGIASPSVDGVAWVPSAEVVDVAALPSVPPGNGPVVQWSGSNQLQTNVVTLPPQAHIAAHVEAELDVTLSVLLGSFTLRHGPDDDTSVAVVHAPAVVVLLAGTHRSVTAGPAGTTYLTVHRRRTGMLPVVR